MPMSEACSTTTASAREPNRWPGEWSHSLRVLEGGVGQGDSKSLIGALGDDAGPGRDHLEERNEADHEDDERDQDFDNADSLVVWARRKKGASVEAAVPALVSGCS